MSTRRSGANKSRSTNSIRSAISQSRNRPSRSISKKAKSGAQGVGGGTPMAED